MTDAAATPGPERNLLRALNGATIDLHKALQRLVLKGGGRYKQAPHYHDWDTSPYLITWPFRDLPVPAVCVFPWDRGTGQTLAEFADYYRTEIPRRAPLTIVVTSSPLTRRDLAEAEMALHSPLAVIQAQDGDPDRLAWIAGIPPPKAVSQVGNPGTRQELQEIDPADAVERFQNAQPVDRSRKLEDNLTMPRRVQVQNTMTLLLINVAVFIFAIIKNHAMTGLWDTTAPAVMDQLALMPQVANGEWWRLVSCAFMHFGIIHIGFNMLFLYQFGPIAETFLGSRRFLTIYLIAMLTSSLCSMTWHYGLMHIPAEAAGASGALMGMYLGTLGFVLAQRKVLAKSFVRGMVRNVAINSAILLVMGLFAGFDNAGHFGGSVGGFIVGYAYGMQTPLQPRWAVKFKWLLATLLLLLFPAAALAAVPSARELAGYHDYATSFNTFQSDMNHFPSDLSKLKPGAPLPWDTLDDLQSTYARLSAQPQLQEVFRRNPILQPVWLSEASDLKKFSAILCKLEAAQIYDGALHLCQSLKGGAAPAAAQARATVQGLSDRLTSLLNRPAAQDLERADATWQSGVTALQAYFENCLKTGQYGGLPSAAPLSEDSDASGAQDNAAGAADSGAVQ
ncbi:MAG: rhomboid family intramembrane serine protease [Planctomycetota bacterium]